MIQIGKKNSEKDGGVPTPFLIVPHKSNCHAKFKSCRVSVLGLVVKSGKQPLPPSLFISHGN